MIDNEMTLSAALYELESTVKLLEQEPEIEKATELYEKAMKLSVYCTKKITQAKQKVTELSSDGEENA